MPALISAMKNKIERNMNMQYLQGLETRNSRPHPSGNKYTMSPTLGEPNVSETELDSALLKIFGPTLNKKLVTPITNGNVYDIRFTKDNLKQLERYRPYFKRKVSRGEQSEKIPTDKHLIVKLVLISRDKKENKKQPQPEMYTSIAKEITREIRIQGRLTDAGSKTIAGKKYDIQNVIPKLYYGGFDGHVGLIIMEKLPGTTLTEVLMRTDVSLETLRWIIAKFEYALCCLFLNGYIHGDLHSYNVQVDLHKRSVYLLDFGRTITMTPGLVKDFERYLVQHRQHAIMEFWKNKAEPYGNAAVYERAKKYPSARAWWSNVGVVSRLATAVMDQEKTLFYDNKELTLKKLRDEIWVPEKPEKPEKPRSPTFRERQQQLNAEKKQQLNAEQQQQLKAERQQQLNAEKKRKAKRQQQLDNAEKKRKAKRQQQLNAEKKLKAERQQQLDNAEKKRKAKRQPSREPTESPPVLLKRKPKK